MSLTLDYTRLFHLMMQIVYWVKGNVEERQEKNCSKTNSTTVVIKFPEREKQIPPHSFCEIKSEFNQLQAVKTMKRFLSI